MSRELQVSQRQVMRRGAKTANKMIRQELRNTESPITQKLTTTYTNWREWTPLWNPFVVNWHSSTGFGLALRDSDAAMLSTPEVAERIEEIVYAAILDVMIEKPKLWIGPMLQDLASADSFYERFVQ